MKPILFPILLLATVSAIAAPPSLPAPLVLSSNEEIVFEGGAGDSVQCKEKTYNKQVFNIKVTKNAKECDADGNLLRKIYIDGVLTDVCNTDVKTSLRDLKGTFTDFDDLLALSDEDFRKFLGNWNNSVGNCQFQEPSTMSSVRNDPSGKLQNSFQTYLVETQIELKQSKPNDATTTKAARDFIKAGLCGSYSPARLEANKKDSLKFFGRSNIGYDAFAKKGFTVDQLVEMQYPVKTLKDHGVGIDKLVAAGKSLSDLYNGGFTINDLKTKFTLKDMVSANLSSELKANGYKAQDLKAAGATFSNLQSAGFDPAKELKSIYSVAEIMNAKDGYGRRAFGNDYLRSTMGYTATELKTAGLSLSDLRGAGYDLSRDLKPLYTVKDFMAEKDGYGRAAFNVGDLRSTFGYSAQELRDNGVGVRDLEQAGYDAKKDLKPIFKIQDFQNAKDGYGRTAYDNDYLHNTLGYSAAELKGAGVGVRSLEQAGYDMKKEVKPLFTIQDFMAAKDGYGRQAYSADYLRSTLGYSATEQKAAGLGVRDLEQAGYDIRTEVRPLFKVQDFADAKDGYGRRAYSNDYLRSNLGFSAAEVKSTGAGIRDLENAGFDLKADVKPLYSVQDFADTKDGYGRRAYSNEYLRNNLGYSAVEVKSTGASITEMQSAGFDLKTEVKPLFSIDDIIVAKDGYGRRAFSNQQMRESFGYSAKEMRDEGLGLQDLSNAGYTKQELKDAGFNPKMVDAL